MLRALTTFCLSGEDARAPPALPRPRPGQNFADLYTVEVGDAPSPLLGRGVYGVRGISGERALA